MVFIQRLNSCLVLLWNDLYRPTIPRQNNDNFKQGALFQVINSQLLVLFLEPSYTEARLDDLHQGSIAYVHPDISKHPHESERLFVAYNRSCHKEERVWKTLILLTANYFLQFKIILTSHQLLVKALKICFSSLHSVQC